MGAERYVVRCSHCGTAYGTRSWYWLDVLGIECAGESASEVRRCAVPGCSQTLARASRVALSMGLARERASNDAE
jgi:hypothetical protein